MEIFSSFLSKDPKKLPVVLPPAFWIVSGISISDSSFVDPALRQRALDILNACWKGDGWGSSCDTASSMSLLATYSAILIHTILQTPVASADAIVGSLRSFLCSSIGITNHLNYGSPDVRFLYCLVGSFHLLNHLLTPNESAPLIDFIYSSQTPEGGFGCEPGSEAHAGHTFCAIASLTLLNAPVPNKARLTEWLSRRIELPSGRPEKREDCCYAWWVGASWVMLGFDLPVDRFRNFLNSCRVGPGFAPRPGQDADLFHSFFASVALGLLDNSVDPRLAIPRYFQLYPLPISGYAPIHSDCSQPRLCILQLF